MIIYNQAFDLYHTIYRIILFLNRFEEGVLIEVDRLRIWDFYLLFPNKIHKIRFPKSESDLRKLKNQFIKESNNPYETIMEERKIFEKLKPYQLSALNCIASYGIIDKGLLNQQRISITNKQVLTEFMSKSDDVTAKEKNIISLMTSHFFKMSLYGTNGLKNRTNLMESKYDAQ